MKRNLYKIILLNLISLAPIKLIAGIDENINNFLDPVSKVVSSIVFYSLPIGTTNVELIVIWLILGGLFCTFYFRFEKGFWRQAVPPCPLLSRQSGTRHGTLSKHVSARNLMHASCQIKPDAILLHYQYLPGTGADTGEWGLISDRRGYSPLAAAR